MPQTYRGHLDDLPIDQLDPRIRIQQTHLGHPVIVGHCPSDTFDLALPAHGNLLAADDISTS